MKIAILSAANSTHTVKIANSLAELGHEVEVFSLLRHADIDNAMSDHVAINYLKYKFYHSNIFQLKRGLQRFAPDVLYAHYITGYGALARLSGFHPTVLAVWGTDVYEFPNKSFIHKRFITKNLSFADRLFSTSNVMAKETKKYTSKDILTTPFGVDLEEFYPLKKLDDDKRIRVGFVKGVSEKYGISYLVKAFALLVEKYPELDLALEIYGDGNQLIEMKSLVDKLGISQQVTFHGRIPHERVADALRTMDIFCVPSLWESFGVAAIEAMACGIPCIVSDADGLREVTVDGLTGVIVPRRDEQALFLAIDDLIQYPEKRCQMGLAAREHVEELYDWKKNIKTIEQGLYEAIRSVHA